MSKKIDIARSDFVRYNIKLRKNIQLRKFMAYPSIINIRCRKYVLVYIIILIVIIIVQC